MISHDRNFLNELVTHILEIRHGNLIRYRGNYEDYLAQREAAEEQLASAYKNQQREIAHMMDFVNRFRAKNTKAAQAQSKLKQIERMEKIEAPENDDKKIKFQFPQPQRSGLKVITLKDVHHAYGENVIYRGIEFQAERDQRTVLVGPNGAGKSTLLKILAGVLPLQSGERELGHNVKAVIIRNTALICWTRSGRFWRRAWTRRNGCGRNLCGRCWAVFFFGAMMFSRRSRAERRRKKPPGAGETAARPAEFIVDGRADDASGHAEY